MYNNPMSTITKQAYVILANGFEEVEALTPIDFLRRAEIPTTTVGLSGKEITGSHGVPVIADAVLEEFATQGKENKKVIDEHSIIILPGGLPGADNLAKNTILKDILVEHNKLNGLIAAICASPARVLYPLSFLNGKKFTCYPALAQEVQNAEYVEEKDVVCDGNIITSKGVGTAALFAAKIISILSTETVAEKIWDSTLQKTALY